MRNNTSHNAVCDACGNGQKESLRMFDLKVGSLKATICDECNQHLFSKSLSATVLTDSKVKSKEDLKLINRRKLKSGWPV